MRLIIIGSDRKLFDEKSAVRMRTEKYAARLSEMHIIIFSLRTHKLEVEHAGNMHVYPTNSSSRLRYVFDALRIGRSIQADIVSAQDPFESGLAAYFVAIKNNIPLHLQVHTDIFSPYFKKSSLLNRLRLSIANYLLPRAKGIRAVSQNLKENIRKKYQTRASISALPIFVDVEKFRNIVRTKHPRFNEVLLWIGRFEKEKNPLLAIEACARARNAGHDAGLVMLGRGSLEEELKKRVEMLGLSSYVEFKGWQDPREYFAMADITLVTSLYEGYGLTVIESLAAGIPVLSTDVGIAREAGAMTAHIKDFSQSLVEFLEKKRMPGELKGYPYKSEDDYTKAYIEDITACARA